MNPDERPSKSQRKRDMDALQRMGEELALLNPDQLSHIELPERLVDAIDQARRISGFEARRRQLQYIGKLMRDVDPAPIRELLAQWRGASAAHVALHHEVEQHRQRMLADDSAINEFAARYPTSDVQRIRSLVASIKRDQAAGRPLKNNRELFRLLHQTLSLRPPDSLSRDG